MKLKAYIDDIDSICSTCESCDSNCAGYTFKNFFESELKIEEALQLFNCGLSDPANNSIQT